jgi:excisionase family DNA binding protein
VPPEVEQAIDKRSGMAAVGNLNDYVKFQMAGAMGQGGGSVAAAPAEMAIGFAMAQQMAQGMASPGAPPPLPGAPAASTTPALDVLTPEQAAQALGVSVEDVVATLEKGELKGRKIGSAWRIARTSLDEYLRGA